MQKDNSTLMSELVFPQTEIDTLQGYLAHQKTHPPTILP